MTDSIAGLGEELAALLRAQGMQVSVGEFIRLVGESIHRQRSALRPGGSSPEGSFVRKAIADYSALVARSLRVREAAVRLRVDESTVRRRIRRGDLYGFCSERHWLLPQFQFCESGTLPGLATALKDIDGGAHALSVHRFFVIPRRDLVVGQEDEAVSPRQWLLRGESPEVVRKLSAAIEPQICMVRDR
ncbi:helix-turn-helix domain-containing protein [Pelagibius sp. 7325]|uniref:helix-turn-helix domain-containing protein n=1 Tax=Pelagibius sp. 7325 TaxID=3131994 RepID=UPI0030EF9F2E